MSAGSAERIIHPFAPVYDRHSRILILGTMPSVASRRDGFYYGHPRNRFWPVLAALVREPVALDVAQKRSLLLRHRIALWDVLRVCDIEASSDASIRNALPNDLAPLLRATQIHTIYCNGGTAYRLYKRHCAAQYGLPYVGLPSTSPANARMGMPQLCATWQVILG